MVKEADRIASQALFDEGSSWRRWDPHIHAPGTLLNDGFKGDWETYLARIEKATPVVEVLGVTDYFSIRGYREVKERKAAGRLPSVRMIFPNVEIRLDIKTAKQRPINLHLLFSPDDPNHEREIERVLSRLHFELDDRPYACTTADLAALGRAFKKEKLDDEVAIREGVNQFKVTLVDLRKLFRSDVWVRKNCLVAVAGNLGDGTSGLQDDDAFAATRREIERFAHIIFSATPSQREYWLGKRSIASATFIEETYGALKPCLHGSDAHREEAVVAPDLDRFCWLKGDPIFETLRQAVLEPEERAWIGAAPPVEGSGSNAIMEVRVGGAPWLVTNRIRLNPGLVAIIGARGSGKTALADMVAAGSKALSTSQGESSFVRRATRPVNHLADATVELVWSDGTAGGNVPLQAARDDDEELATATYLSQHFVEQLCSASGLATALRAEMERVVFEATDPTMRLGATSFSALIQIMLEPAHVRRQELRETIGSISERVVQEDSLKEKLPRLAKDRAALSVQIDRNSKTLASLVPKANADLAKTLGELEKACANREAAIETLFRRKKALDDLATEVKHVTTYSELNRHAEMKRRFAMAQLDEKQWDAFRMRFVGEPTEIIRQEADLVSAEIERLTNVNAASEMDLTKPFEPGWPLVALRAKREQVKKVIGIEAARVRQYNDLQKVILKQQAELRRVTEEIAHSEQSEGRRAKLIDIRRAAYADVFRTFTDEERVLAEIYAPLKSDLASASGTLGKLQFVVHRHVDVDAWVKRGEDLIDLRRETRLRGHGTLKREAERLLLNAWSKGTADEVAVAMDAFRSEFQSDLLRAQPATVKQEDRRRWIQEVAAWLYDTSHISVEYGIQYDGVAIERLSPGTRGIVLLLLYLALDRHDQRPLLIDQPEENLDPNSVFHELVPHFREARKRRQVIVVTHNANLVVNTDVDQVIVAESVRDETDSLPNITYRSGSLENSDIRRVVCEILEGGERAFLERERRYRLRWDEIVGPEPANTALGT